MQHYLRGEGTRAKPGPLRFLGPVPSVFQSRPPGFIVAGQGSLLLRAMLLLQPISSEAWAEVGTESDQDATRWIRRGQPGVTTIGNYPITPPY